MLYLFDDMITRSMPNGTVFKVADDLEPERIKESLQECGRQQIIQSDDITNGWEAKPGEYPWHAVVYHKSSRNL